MSCLLCTHGALRGEAWDADRDRHVRRCAALGMVNCKLSPFKASFHHAEHVCPRYVPASQQVRQARLQWVANKVKKEVAQGA